MSTISGVSGNFSPETGKARPLMIRLHGLMRFSDQRRRHQGEGEKAGDLAYG
jgi:hypothetical protein